MKKLTRSFVCVLMAALTVLSMALGASAATNSTAGAVEAAAVVGVETTDLTTSSAATTATTVASTTIPDEGVAINYENFGDSTFRAYVLNQVDKNGDGVLSKEEALAVESMDVSDMDIYSLEGIEYFTALKTLDCSGNGLYSLDVSNLKKLHSIDVSDNRMDTLDLTQNPCLNTVFAEHQNTETGWALISIRVAADYGDGNWGKKNGTWEVIISGGTDSSADKNKSLKVENEKIATGVRSKDYFRVQGKRYGVTNATLYDGDQIAAKFKVSVFFINVNPYQTSYYTTPVYWAAEEGITTGKSGGRTFAPAETCTRAQIVTFLWRFAGEPEPTIENPFKDIKASAYYYKAVLWAYENGITTGRRGGSAFDPNGTCTRREIVTFLWRYAGEPTPSKAGSFKDVKSKGTYYYNAVYWAVEQGITTGKKATNYTTFDPTGLCTRGMAVTFLYRYAKAGAAGNAASETMHYAASFEEIPDGALDAMTQATADSLLAREGVEELVDSAKTSYATITYKTVHAEIDSYDEEPRTYWFLNDEELDDSDLEDTEHFNWLYVTLLAKVSYQDTDYSGNETTKGFDIFYCCRFPNIRVSSTGAYVVDLDKHEVLGSRVQIDGELMTGDHTETYLDVVGSTLEKYMYPEKGSFNIKGETGEYAQDLGDIPTATIEEMKATTKSEIPLWSGKEIEFLSEEYCGAVLCVKGEAWTDSYIYENYLTMVYKVTVKTPYHTDDDPTYTYYFTKRFGNVVLEDDGTCTYSARDVQTDRYPISFSEYNGKLWIFGGAPTDAWAYTGTVCYGEDAYFVKDSSTFRLNGYKVADSTFVK